MKFNYVFTAVCSFFFMQAAMAQQSVVQENEPEIIQTISVRRGQPQQVHDRAYYELKVKEIDELLESIEVKISHVKSDEEEHKIATQNGWYTNMERIKEESRKQRLEYEEVIKKMRN